MCRGKKHASFMILPLELEKKSLKKNKGENTKSKDLR